MRILKNSIVNTLLIGIIMMAILLCCNSQAQAQDGDYTYTVTNGAAQITRYYTGAGIDVAIPSTLGGYPVTSIGDWAFSDYYNLKSIIIPEGVTSIGRYAFGGCYDLTSISLPQTLTSIGPGAFGNCYGLISISLPQTLTSIGIAAFSNCISLTSIIIPEGVTSISNRAFTYCYSLTSISLPQTLTSIDYDTFGGCISLTSIIIPEGVTSIGHGAFSQCESLTSISLPQTLTSIGYHAFYRCISLTSISLPQGVTSIGDWAFFNCTSLTNITFNSATTTIYNASDTIPSQATIIGYDPSTAKDYATKYGRTFELIYDSLYKPDRDGYRFNNSYKSFGYPEPYYIPTERYLEVFGAGAINNHWFSYFPWGGNCFGMSVTSKLFALNELNPSVSHYPRVNMISYNVYDISEPRIRFAELTKLIEQYQIRINSLEYYTQNVLYFKSLNDVVNDCTKATQNDSLDDAVYIGLSYGFMNGHALIPYRVVENSEGVYRIYVYDSNDPGNMYRYIEIDLNNNTWGYQFTQEKYWHGSGSLAASNKLRCCSIKSISNVVKPGYLFAKSTGFSFITASSADRIEFEDAIGNTSSFENGVLESPFPETMILPNMGALADQTVNQPTVQQFFLPFSVYKVTTTGADEPYLAFLGEGKVLSAERYDSGSTLTGDIEQGSLLMSAGSDHPLVMELYSERESIFPLRVNLTGNINAGTQLSATLLESEQAVQLATDNQSLNVNLQIQSLSSLPKSAEVNNLLVPTGVPLRVGFISPDSQTITVSLDENNDGVYETETPVVVSAIPADNENDVPIDSPVKLKFNAPITSDINFSQITVSDGTNNNIDFQCFIEGDILTITPNGPFAKGTQHTVTIPTSSIKNQNNESLLYNYTLTFSTANDGNVEYNINTSSLTGGTIVANPASAEAGATVNLTITPAKGMMLKPDSLKYNDGATDTLIEGSSFLMPAADITVSAEFEAEPDTIAPVITAPADIEAEATGLNTTVTLNDPTVIDASPVTIVNDAPNAFPLGTTMFTWTVTDSSGNSATASQNVIIADTTKPVVTAPADIIAILTGVATPIDIGQATVSDIFPVSVTNDAPATFPVGTTLVTWTATDDNGNMSTATQQVAVSYAYCGILKPIKSDGTSLFKMGQTIPVQFQLKDANGKYVSFANATISYAFILDNVVGIDTDAVSEANSTIGNAFRYDAKIKQYIFNMNTTGLSSGTYQLSIKLDDGNVYKILVSLK